MDWKAVGTAVANAAPLLGTLLGGPAGPMLGSLIAHEFGTSSDPTAVVAAITADPNATVKLQQIAADHDVALKQMTMQMAQAELASDTAQIQAVNQTLQADARGDSWLQKNHHAVESLMAVSLVISIYFLLPLLKIAVPEVPGDAWLMLGAILGINNWKRGDVNKQLAVNQGQGN